MPVTGILSKEYSQEGCEVQNPSVDTIHDIGDNLQAHMFENSSSEVSATTMDSSKGYHDTFAAFPSASSGGAEVETDVDVATSVPAAENEAAVELQDPSAHDSSQVTTETQHMPDPVSDVDMQLGLQHGHMNDLAAQSHESAVSDCVYFIQTTDTSGQVVASIIDPNDISMYVDSVIYKQCLNEDGEIETTIVHSGSSATTQHQTQDDIEDTGAQQAQQQGEQQVIYAHDLSGQLIPLDPVQSAEEVAPPGKQFVYMQDVSGRIIRTVMDASQNMVPGQQVYYTQSDDGQIITSLMDSSTAAASEDGEQQQNQLQAGEQVSQQQVNDMDITGHQQQLGNLAITDQQPVSITDQQPVSITDHQLHNDVGFSHQQQVTDQQLSDVGIIGHHLQSSNVNITNQQQSSDADMQHQVETKTHVIDRSASFSIDNGLSGLSMLAELSHLTSGQGVMAPGMAAEHKLAPVTDSSNSVDTDRFRSVAKVTEQVPTCDEGLESMSSDIAEMKVTEVDSDSVDHGSLPQGCSIGQDESLLTRIVSQLSQISPSVCRDNLFIQWQNLDAMCWMDVILIMLVHSPSLRPLTDLDPSHELASTLLVTLLKANRQAQILLQNLLRKHNGAVITDPHTAAPVQDPKTSKIVCKETMDEIGKAINVLYAMREKIWLALQPRLRCERGKHNSPVLVLPLLVRENPTVKKMFTMRYRNVFKCEKCSYTQDDSHSKILPSIPTVPEDFNMTTPCFVRNCFECLAPNQRMMMQFEQLQDFVQMHFVKGLPHSRFDELSFDFNDDHYEVTAFVHYKNNPDHFIAWVRNAPGTMWMECDDLKSVITRYSQAPPNIPPSQVHMVMWERRLAPRHALVMRDTEDTRLLASLVLTVQQPNTHHTTDSDTRSSSLSSGTASSTATSHSSTSLLSGLMTQSLASLAQRGRGSGRGGRSNGVQAAASTIAAIRQMNPVGSQLSSVGHPPPAAPSRVISLPLSALSSSGLSLRGGSPGAAKYVLVGNNSQGGTLTRPGTNSRVVVVRTPGGAASMSAAQLLQLLQRSGAVGQIGTRLTAAVTSSGASTVVPATEASYIVQRDGNMSTASSTDLPERTVFTKQGHGIDGSCVMTNTSQSTQNDNEQTSTVTPQTISTLPFSTSGHTVNPDTTAKWSQPETSKALPPQGSSASTISVTKPILGGLVKPSQSQQQRYLKVTKPGGGTFLCQLAMKDGKMVLLPVERSIQAGSTSTPSLSTTTEVPAGSQQLLQGSHQADSTRTRLISFPGTQGGNKIQVASGSFTHTDQPGSKTVMLNSAGRQADANSASSIATNVFSEDASGVGFDGGSMPAVCTSLGTSVDSEMGNVSSPATSLLMDVSPYSSCRQQQQQVHETFRYVPPGSNTTHILHTGTNETQGSPGQSVNACAALSSSGAVVDGQSISSEVSVAEEMILNNSDTSQTAVLTSKQNLSKEFDTTEYIPLGHGRIHGARGGRGRRGRGRGGRGRGGRGRGRAAIMVSKAEPLALSAVSSQMSTLSDLQQIGAHIIRADCEAVDGVPVVSIPDFSTEIDAQTIMPEISGPANYETHAGDAPQQAQDSVDALTAASSGLGSPRGTGQITTSYGFKGSTQGTQGSPDRTRQPPSTLKHTPSLLVGGTTTLQPASSLLVALSDTTAASGSSQGSGQTDVDEVQQAAAQTGSQALAVDVGTDIDFGDSGFSLDDTIANTDGATKDSAANVVNVHEAVFTQPEVDENDTVMSVEENHESTAERYRMPTELFQPEEESPEKCVKLDEATSRVSVSLSPGMFQESERSSLVETQTLSQSPNRNAALCSPIREAEMEESGVQPESLEHTDGITGEVEMTAPCVGVVHKTLAAFSPCSKVRKGRCTTGTSRQGIHKSDFQPELQGIASDSSDGSAGSERVAGSLSEQEAFLHTPSMDLVEQSVPSSGCATEAGDLLEDGLQDGVDVKDAEGSPKAGRSIGRSETCKRGGGKNSGSTRSGHNEHVSAADLETKSSCDTVNTIPLPELAETSTHVPDGDSVPHSEPEPVGVDGYTAETVEVDGYTAETVEVDSCTAEPFGVDGYTSETAGVDGYTAGSVGVDSYTAEPVDSCTTEPVEVDSCTTEPVEVDSYTAEPVEVDSCTAEPVEVDSCTAEPVEVDSYTAEPVEVDSCTAEPVEVDSCTAEPVEVDSYTTEPVEVDSCTTEPVELDSYTAEPVDSCTTELVEVDSCTAETAGVDSYTAETAGVDGCTAETAGVDGYTAETAGVDGYTAEPVFDSCTTEPVEVDSCTAESVEVDSCTAEPVEVDSCTAEPVEVDSYTAEPVEVDSYTAEPFVVDGYTAETAGVDGYTAETAGVDGYTAEAAGVDGYTAGSVGVDGYTAETAGVDGYTAETAGVDCYTAEPVFDSCTTEPVEVDSCTAEPVKVDSCTAEPVEVDSYTAEPVEIDSYTAEPAGVDSYTAEPIGVDSYTAEPIGVDGYTAEPAGIDSFTAETVGVDSSSSEPVGVDFTAETVGVDGFTAETVGVDGFTAETVGVDGFTAETVGVDSYTAEPAMDSAYVAVEVELKSQDVIEDHQHDASVALFEDSYPDRSPHDAVSQLDRPIPFVADCHPDRTIPSVEDSHPDRTIPIVAESHPHRSILFVEDSQPDRPIALAEESQGDVPLPHVADSQCDGTVPQVADSQYDETIPHVADSLCDGTVPQVADSQCDGTVPQIADSQCDGTVPQVADSQYDETLPHVADSQCDGTVPQVADSQYDETIPHVADSLCDGTVPQVADSQCDGTVPQIADSQCDGTVPQVADSKCDETIPHVADSLCDGTVPQVADSQCDGTVPQIADSQFDETIPHVADSQYDETIPQVADSQYDETISQVVDSQCDGTVPQVADSQYNETIPQVADSQYDETIPQVADSQCDETISQVVDSQCDETIHSSVLPRKMKRSRGRHGSGRSRHGKRGKSSRPLLVESMDNTRSGSSPLAEHAVSSPGCNSSSTSTLLSSPENKSMQCSEVFHAGSLVPDSLIPADAAVEQLHEDVDHVTPEVICQVEAECDGSLKVDNSKGMLRMSQEQGSRQLPDESAVFRESVSLIPLETFMESAVTSGYPSEGSTHITSLDKEPLHNTDCDDPPGEWRTLLASGLSSATDVLLEDEIHMTECSTQLNNEGIETVLEAQGNVSTKTGGRSGGRAKSRTRKPGMSKRSDDTVAVEAAELCASATESVKATTAADTLELSQQKSPTSDPSQQHETQAASSVGPVSSSVSAAGLVCQSAEESRRDCLEVTESEDVIATVASSASEKTSMPSRPKERKSKHRGKRKSDKGASEHPEPSSTFPAVSSDVGTDCTVNSEYKLHSNHLPQIPARQGVILEHRKRVLSPAVQKDVQKKARIEQEVKEVVTSSTTAVYYKRKKVDWGIISDVDKGTDQRASFSYTGLTGRCVVSSARHPLLDQERQASVPPRYSRLVHHPPGKNHTSEASSLAVVKRRRQKPQQRPELNSSCEVIPLSLNRHLYPGCTGGSAVKDIEGKEAFTGVVMRRRHTRADWSCSADTDKSLGNLTKERLQSVPVKYCKRLMSSLCIGRGDLSAAVRVSGKHLEKSVASEEGKADSVDPDVLELQNTCNSGMLDSLKACHDALVGSEKSCDNDVIDSERTYDENVGDSEVNCDGDVVNSGKTYDDVVSSGKTYDDDLADSEKACDNVADSEKACDVVDSENTSKNVIESETACVSNIVPTGNTGDVCAEISDQAMCTAQVSVYNTSKKKSKKLRSKHNKRKNLSTEATHSAKKAKPSLDDGSPSFPSQSCLKELGDSPLHTNDVHTALAQAEAVRDLSPAVTSSACLSPTRRSGRTPTPSKRIRDAFEYLKMPSPLKLHRVSSVSSDDRQAEFSSDTNLEFAHLS